MCSFSARIAAVFFLTAACCVPVASQNRPSWLVDPAAFHISPHGKSMSCADCHGATASLHPDPKNITRAAPTPGSSETCGGCHADVLEKLGAGIHGKATRASKERYENCLSCHDPHSTQRRGETALKSARQRCAECHAEKKDLPQRSAEDERCLSCHGLEPSNPAHREKFVTLCFECHGSGRGAVQQAAALLVPRIDQAAYRRTPHYGESCVACHTGAAAYRHGDQPLVECVSCHGAGKVAPVTSRRAPFAPHYADMVDDPHIGVDCAACHSGGGRVQKTAGTRQIARVSDTKPGGFTRAHNIVREPRGAGCRKCHTSGNAVGAAAMVLPSKNLLCVGCHTATFSPVGDATTVVALLIFLAGLAAAASYWLSGSAPRLEGAGAPRKLLWAAGAIARTVASPRIFAIARTLVVDGLLQRRLLRRSPVRWAIHSLIFLPFVVRFLWGLVGVLAANLSPRSTWYVFLLDKNHPATALVFDVTGVLVIVGICAAIVRGITQKAERLPGLPGQDRAALALIGGIVLIGFVLEGMRIAMTEGSGTAAFAFLGYAISRAFAGWAGTTAAYGYVWYAHAILTGAFVAYLPFSRMFHILMAPVALAISAAREHGHSSEAMVPETASGD